MEQTPRQQLAKVLRAFGLLPLADLVWFFWLYLRTWPANRRFMREHPAALIPPPVILYDIHGNCDLSGFYYSGREHAKEIANLIAKHRSGPLQILEWGCGPARVLQHLPAIHGQVWQLYGSDYNPRTIEWCQRCLPGIEFYHNQLAPPIPVESVSMDVVYCISVFTHLSAAMHRQWMDEIHRILKPGGLFIGTFHGANYRDELTPDEQQQFDAGKLVVRDKIREGKKNFTAFHGDLFVQELLELFSSNWQESLPLSRQSVWCAVKAEQRSDAK